MQINRTTLYRDVLPLIPFFEAGEEARLMVTAEHMYARDGWWSIPVGQFVELSNGDYKSLGVDKDNIEDITALQYYAIMSFKGFVDEFIKVVEALDTPRTSKERQAESACRPMSLAEGLLVFVRKYFGLRSFDEAANIPLSDYIIAKKDTYNSAMFERTYMSKK